MSRKLYSYLNMKVEKHEIGLECLPQLVREQDGRSRYRCRHRDVDFYGYFTLREAKAEEIQDTVKDIYDLTIWLKKLRGLKE